MGGYISQENAADHASALKEFEDFNAEIFRLDDFLKNYLAENSLKILLRIVNLINQQR